jgi:hypothetical protein
MPSASGRLSTLEMTVEESRDDVEEPQDDREEKMSLIAIQCLLKP